MSGNGLRNARSETNENEFENPVNSIHFPPPRSPLNTIQDPSSQNPREIVEDESDSRIRLAGNQIGRILGKNAEASELVLGISNYWTPKGVRGKSHSEPNSVQSTPAKSSSKVSNYGMSGSYNGNRALQCTGAKGGSFSRAAKGKSDVIFWPSVEVPHFDLIEDPSFWTDHNVQVLIRIRPLSNKERSLQGNGRCLRQESERSLTWLGHPETRFTFDHIVCETITQEMLFKVAGLPMVENCMSGYNSCMFAYGQTGSGKTYTMMGEVFEINNKLSEDCGMTPRIFEYLFTRIKEGEESRRDEKLTYSCKCSFLEIYNEQITDLLEPSSNNLQLREDMKNGVYVENLKEYDVATVEDVVKLLLQGAANRKMAATDMNSESSRSHSVFTCVIESRWEKDSMTHLRFGRLNLVDLAGSERQKSSGAEGERLKEAANINKSLSTLGLVIMTLVDVAHGKHRHVPYRDSRLTFLLQDSLGGNSKTTIIANVTPSICSVTETLSTLKFAQRAKLIQNNAKVNEDASGNVMALQRQIQQLKDQLNFVLNDQNIARPLSFHTQNIEQANFGEFHACNPSLEGNSRYAPTNLSVTNRKMECMEAVLVGALRREKMAETAVRRLEAEIAHMNRLVHQQEEDAQRTKMILRFREEKIRRMELLANGLMSADEYLAEENNVLSEEIQLLQARIDRSPELTRFALENIRLIEQLRMFQDFYEQGERETLLAEVSELRDQLLEVINETYEEAKLPSRIIVQDEVKIDQTVQERAALLKEAGDMEKELEVYKKNLDACLETNATLAREVDNMHCQLKRYLIGSGTVLRTDEDPVSRNSDTTMEIVNHSSVKLTSVRTDSEDEIESHKQVDKSLQIKCDAITLQPIDAQKELVDAKYLIEAMESDQICLIKEIENLKEENNRYLKLLRCNDHNHIRSIIQLKTHSGLSERQETSEKLGHQDWGQVTKGGGISKSALQTKLEKLQRDLDEATILNRRYQDDQASQLSHQHEVERVREQVEVETAKTIIHLQEELSALLQEIDSMKASESLEIRHSVLLKTENQELQERLCLVTQENILLKKAIADRENEMSGLGEEWEKAIFDLTSFLIDGYQSIEDASDQIENIVNSFPPRKSLISEHVEKAVKVFIEKEKLIALLQKKLEDAEKMGFELKVNLSSLKGATLAITEVQQLENNESVKEVIHLKTLLSEKLSVIHDLEKKIKSREGQLIEAEKRADDAFVALERLSEVNAKLSLHTINAQGKDAEQEILELNMNYTIEQDKNRSQDMKAEASARAMEEIGEQVEMAMERVLDSDTAICASYVDTEKYLSSLLSDIIDASPEARQLVQDFINDVCTMKKKFIGLKEQNTKNPCLIVASPSFNARGSGKLRNQYALLLSVRDELAKTNEKLNVLKNGIDTLSSTYGCSVEVGDEAMLGLNILASTTCKSSLCTPKCVLCCNNNVIEEMNKIESEAEEKSDELLSSISHTGFSGETTEEKQDLLPVRDSKFVLSDHEEFQGPGKDLIPNDATIWYLRKEVKSAFSSLMNIHVQLSMLLDDKEVAKHTYGQGRHFYESLAVGIDNPQLNMDCKETSNRLVTLEADQMLQIFEHRVEKAGAGCSKSRQMLSQKLNDARLVAEEKMKAANSLLLKFEEAQETIKEADHLLTALVIENDNAKHKTNRWKQAGEELMTERATLIEEVQQLKASIHLKEEQYEFLHDQINGSSVEIMDSISSLENLFLLMRRTVEEEFKVIYSDIFSFGRELLDYIGTSRSWLEDICSEIMEKGFFLSVLYQCHLGILSENILSLNGGSTFLQYGHGRSNPVPSNMDKIFMDSNREGMEFKVLNDTTEGVGREHSQYGLSGSEGILKDTFRIVQHTVVGSVTDTDFRKCEGPAHSLDLQHYLEKVAKLEEENFGIVHDMQFIKEAITKQLIYLEKFGQELNSLREVSYGVAFPVTHGSPKMGAIAEQLLQAKVSTSSDTSHSSIFYDLGIQSHKIQNHIVSLAQKEGEATKEDVGDVITDGKALYDGIQNLKNQCAQLIALLAEKKDHPKLPLYDKEGMHGNSIEIEKWHLNCLETKTEYGHHSIQALNKLGDKLSYLTGDIYSVMHAETENRLNAPLLETLFQDICSIEEKASIFLVRSSENEVRQTDGISENLSLKRELTRKEDLLKGLLFDFRLLQESTSNAKDLKDETETMMAVLSKLQHELTSKTSLLDDLSVQYIELETQLTDSEAALSSSKSELERAHETLDMLLKENTELRFLLEDLYVKKTDTEEQLEEKKQVVKGLEREILHMTSSVDERILSSIEDIEDELRRVTNERDHLHEEVVSLNDKLEMVNALADENEAIAIEARQVSEASKVVAEQKEEEARILEHSVEELECTINMLEKKVYEMGEEVERHRLMRDNLELELQVLRERMLTVENVTETSNVEERSENQMSRHIDNGILELCEANRRIQVLEKEKANQEEEIKKCREYISELVLHAEAQTSQYQQKYKTLEAMVRDVKMDQSTSTVAASTVNKLEKCSTRTRGSGSPFKCIASLVQQMKLEKDQELSEARLHVEELEAVAASRHKEICMLNARLAAAESMTHDVIRDLLGVKLDMTNYANLIDQQQVQKLVEKAQQLTEEFSAKEQEMLKLKNQIDDFIEERESFIEEIDQRQADALAAQVIIEQLQQRDQLLTAQNEMLKMDKANLKKKISELDEMVKKLCGSQKIQLRIHQPPKIKDNNYSRVGNDEHTERLAQSERLLSRVNSELARYRKSYGKDPYINTGEEQMLRK